MSKSTPAHTENSLALYRRLLSYVWPYKFVFIIAVIAMLLLAATSTGFTAMMKPLVDGGFVNRDPEVIKLLPLLVLGLFVLRALSSLTADYSIGWIGRKVIYTLRKAMFTHMVQLPSSFYDTNPSSVVSAKLIFDVEQIARATTVSLFVLIKDGFTVILMLSWMTYLNWKLTLIVLMITPVVIFCIRLMTSRLRRASKNIQTAVGNISQISLEATEGHRVVKAYNAQETEIENFTKANQSNLKQNMRRIATSAIGVAIIQLLAGVGIALAIYLSLQSGEASAGSFASYITAMMWVMNPAKRLAKVNENIQTGLAAAESAFLLLDSAAEPDNGTETLEQVRGRIEYKNVEFNYPGHRNKVLHDISFVIEPGQTMALVGTSGSGKSTIANLLLRYYPLLSGTITLDGVDTQHLKLADLRHHIALVTQNTILFDDTIKNNITYGADSAIDEARLQNAVKAARVSEFTDDLPQGLDSRIGEKGLLFSGGQRQRIAIARALYKNAPILVLDEATSSLDTESERYVQEAMESLMQGRTTLVIAHRLSTIENADQIVVLDKGRIVEQGTHASLIASKGIYANLHSIQFQADTVS